MLALWRLKRQENKQREVRFAYCIPFWFLRVALARLRKVIDQTCSGSLRILITSKKVVLREYFGWNVSSFGRDLYRND